MDTEHTNTIHRNEYFKRQISIPGWKQETALVLGAGGLGSCVSIQLLRLGIKRIILIDYDKVEEHNLNRQIMFTIDDVGKSKVLQAKKNLQFHNVGQTQIDVYDMNAVKNWGQVISLAKESQVVYNLIDYGDYFDIAVASMCLSLHLPFFQGGTFCNSLSVDYFPADARPCLLCLTDGLNKDMLQKLQPSLIQTYSDIDFLPKNDNPEGQSNIVICQMCANIMNSFLLNELLPSSIKKTKRLLLYLDPIDIVQFDLESMAKCPYCREPFKEGKSEHEEISGDLCISREQLWKDVKQLSLSKLFPEFVEDVKLVEGSSTGIESKFEVTYKDGAKWTIELLEISSLKQSVVYDLKESNPKFPCIAVRNTLNVLPSSDNSSLASRLEWKTEFLDDISINAFQDTQLKKQEYLASLTKSKNN